LEQNLDAIIEEALNNPALADREGEARNFAFFITETAVTQYQTGYAIAELAASGRVAEFSINSLATTIQRNFERAETKEEVDKAQDSAESELRNMSGYRLSQIDNVYEHHIDRLEGNDFVQLLTDTITSEVSLLLEQIVSYADNKKAELDAAAASRAKQVLGNAKERAS
jgi:hypothetical protein